LIGDLDGPNRINAAAVFWIEPDGEVELPIALQNCRRVGAAERCLNDGIDVAGVEAVTGGLVAIDLDVEIGLTQRWKMPRSATPLTFAISAITWVASDSSTSRFGPMILTELAPFTPDNASSTLSWIYCEKLKPIPGNSSANSFCNSSVSFSLVKFGGHSSKGFSGANNSTLENGEASLPLSGRPCWDTTVNTSGCLNRISRIFPVAAVPASSDIVEGIAALIQKLPSSNAGKNSLPRREAAMKLKPRKTMPTVTATLMLPSAKRSTGV
jgi:hypothetical protein